MSETHDDSWRQYFEVTADLPPHAFFDRLDPYLPEPGSTAIDLGAGPGRGTRRLLERGLQVTAVDVSAEALAMLRERVPADAPLEIVHGSFDEIPLARYALAVGCYSLFFLPPASFADFWPRLVDAIEPGGIWGGQFLGIRDEWRTENYTLHDRGDVERLLEGFEILLLEEQEHDGETALRTPKHWHVFHTIARKRS